jgi:hypothetical protein
VASSANVDDAVALTFEAVAGISVTATVTGPYGSAAPVPVAPDATTPAHYPFTFIPDATGIWRVTFRGSGAAVATETYTVTVTDPATGAAPYATSATIEAMWRDMTAEEETRADTLCRYASEIIRAKVPTLDARIAAGKVAADLPALICAQMVLRVLRNPSGVAAETVGPWSVTYGSSGTQATGALLLTDEDMALLTGTPVGARRGYVKAVWSHSRFAPRQPHRRAWGAER